LATEFNVGIATDKSRIEQEVGGLAQHDRAREKPARGFFRSLITPITNPREFVRNVVQNTFFKGTFDARSMSFSRSMMEIAREKHAGLDSSIPFEMPQDILDKSVTEGREIRKKDNVFKRIGYTFYDLGSGLTGLYQNSDMIYAKKWFEANGKPLVDQAKKVSLAEQTNLGERFSLGGENKDVISQEMGETRYRLDELISDETVRNGFQGKIKNLIERYATGQLNDEGLLKEFNQYYHTEVLPKISADKQKELEGIEVSSNILKLGQEMSVEDTMANGQKKTRYQRYQDETTEDGKKKWDELDLKIYLGQGKYETARGEVKLSGLEKKLIHRMVERDYKISNGLVLNSAVETLKDIGIYGGAYLAGGGGAVLMAGRSAFHVGGLIATPLMAGAREGILVSRKGKLYGIRGKSVSDFEQVSRETAQGRASMDKAKLRPMFEKAMVDQRGANELISPIVNLLTKESLTPNEQKQLMMEIAHAKARMRLSDLSTQKGKNLLNVSVAQNFVGFSEGKQNEEMTALRAVIVQGVSKLSQSNPQLYGKIQQAQAVYEAQLKVGSLQNKLARVVSVDTGLSQADAQNIVTEFYQDLGIDTTAGKSLEKASFTLAKVVDRRAATTAAFAAVVSPIIGTELHVVGEGLNLGKHLVSGDVSGWLSDWGQVSKGDVPLNINSSGNLVSNLSSLQKDVLTVESFIHPPPGAAHTEIIDGINITLPGGVAHGNVPGNPDADALVNVRTGEILVHMDKSHLALQDLNGDGISEMVVVNDNNGQSMDAVTALGSFNGVKLIQDPSLNETVPGSDRVVFQPGGIAEKGVDLNGDGIDDVTTKIPANTHWQQDPVDSTKWDLVGNNIDGTSRTLIDDATINSNGQITGGDFDHSVIHIDTISGGSGSTVDIEPTSGGEIWGSAADYRVVHTNGESFDPMRNETFKTGDSAHPYGVKFTFPEHPAIHNPNTGATESLIEMANDNKVGLYLQIPHYGENGEDVGVFVPAHLDSSLHKFVVDFDPTDKTTMISLPNGSQISMADLSQNFLNEGKLADHVSQHSGPGILDSETWYEGRQFFNLANPDGDVSHQGRILGGYFDENSKLYGHDAPPGQTESGAFIAIHAVHGSEPVSEVSLPPPEPPELNYESTIQVGDITETTSTTNLGYRIEVNPEVGNPLPLFLIPMRQNIERSKTQTPSNVTPSTSPTTTVPSVTPVTSTTDEEHVPTEAPVVEDKEALESTLEEKKQELVEMKKSKENEPNQSPETDQNISNLEDEIGELESRISSPPPVVEVESADDKEKAFEEMTKRAKKVLNTVNTESKFYAHDAEEKYFEIIREILVNKIGATMSTSGKEGFYREKDIAEYLDFSLEASLSEDKDVSDNNRKISETAYNGDLGTALQYLKETCASHSPPITSADELIDVYINRLSQKVKEQLSKDPAERNPALHRMASLASVMNLVDEGDLKFLENGRVGLYSPKESSSSISDSESKNIPAIKLTDLDSTGMKETLGSVAKAGVEGAHILKIGPNEKDLPYEVYVDGGNKDKIRIRKIDPNAPTIFMVAINGTTHEVKAAEGHVLNDGENQFIIDGQYYSFSESGVLMPITDFKIIDQLREKIRKGRLI